MSWETVCTEDSDRVTLQQLDDALESLPTLSEEARAAIWLCGFAARENAARVSVLAHAG